MKNGLEDYYVIRGNKKMRFGYTTGSCAAAACKGATEILLSGQKRETVSLMTPKGILLTLQLKDIHTEPDKVTCAIQKDAGDDPDTTNGILVYATCTENQNSRNPSRRRNRRRKSHQSGPLPENRRSSHQPRPKSNDPARSHRNSRKIRLRRRTENHNLCPGRRRDRQKNLQPPPRDHRRNLHPWNLRDRRTNERSCPDPEHTRRNETTLFPGRRIHSGNTRKLRSRLPQRTHGSPLREETSNAATM